MEAILFRKCLGLNDARAFGTQTLIADPRNKEAGNAELIDCLNITTTPDGRVEKIAPLVTVLTHTAPITKLSAGSRFIYQDATNTLEWNGTTSATIGAVLTGPVVHTSLDVRVATATKVYKSAVAGAALTEALLGSTTNIPPGPTPFYSQPPFSQAFRYNGILYGINAASPKFLQYSRYGHNDVWAIGDDYLRHTLPVKNSGQIPGVIIATHDGGVTLHRGSNPEDFEHASAPCPVIHNTLYSGFINKVLEDGHVFLCNDGVYFVGPDGKLVNLTVDQTDYLDALNNSYYCVTVKDGKYLAFGDLCCLEYDFKTKTLLKRSTQGVTGACTWNGRTYLAAGSDILTLGTEIDTALSCSMTFPFSNLGTPGKKSLDCIYFTGTASAGMNITVTDQTGAGWTREVSDELVNVSDYRIKLPDGFLGNHVSFKLDCTSGAFRMEEVRVVLNASKRSR